MKTSIHYQFPPAIVVLFASLVTLNGQETDFARLKSEALSGDTNAQFELGSMHETGQVLLQDSEQAIKWYRMAAKAGHVASHTRLGNMYADGRGVTADKTEAERWFVRAAEYGGPKEQLSLGRMYANGTPIRQSDADAIRWVESAANKGDADAKTELGRMYELGKAVRQSNIDAHKWYSLAVAAGASEASRHRDQIARKMTLDELIDAQKQARSELQRSRLRRETALKAIEKTPEWKLYYRKLSNSIKQRWHAKLKEYPHEFKQAKVVVGFRLHSDGHVSNVKGQSGTTSALLEHICVAAVSEPAPFEPWPQKLRETVGKNFYELSFTFHFE